MESVFSHRLPRLTPKFVTATVDSRQPTDSLRNIHADLAAALQTRTEEVFKHLGQLVGHKTCEENFCISGGVAMNCLGTATIASSGLFSDVFVPPAPTDSGNAIGAALAVARKAGVEIDRSSMRTAYLGPRYSDAEVHSAVTHARLRYSVLGDRVDELVDQLLAGRIIGVFRGRLEAGPRALGNRSILAGATDPFMRDRLNLAVKHREPFRPFAPVVLSERVDEWFVTAAASPYMSFAFSARESVVERIPSAVHRDGTARIQTVDKRDNPWLHRLLSAYAARIGIPVLINTSLNVKGRPICGTPAMAIDCFRESGLDAMVIERLLVQR